MHLTFTDFPYSSPNDALDCSLIEFRLMEMPSLRLDWPAFLIHLMTRKLRLVTSSR